MRTLIGKAVLYGQKTGGSAKNEALTPDMLKDGAIGIYGLHSDSKWYLISDGASTGCIDASAFAGKLIKICQGVATNSTGYTESEIIDIKRIKATNGAKYAAPVAAVIGVGYNETNSAGTMEFGNADIDSTKTLGVTVLKKNAGAFDITSVTVDTVLQNSDTVYTAFKKLMVVLASNGTGKIEENGIEARAKLHTNAPVAATATQDITVTNGSTTVTGHADDVGATDILDTGAYVSIANDLYKIVSAGSTTFELDRPYTGATGTVAAASVTTRTVTLTTGSESEFGIEFVFQTAGQIFYLRKVGLLEYATITQVTNPTQGNGTAAQVKHLEEISLSYRGAIPTGMLEFTQTNKDGFGQLPKLTYDSSKTYDIYHIVFENASSDATSHNTETTNRQTMTVCFESGVADSAGNNQSDFEDIMVVFYSTFTAISA